MKYSILEGIGYYSSSTVLFNLVFILNNCANGNIDRIKKCLTSDTVMLSLSRCINNTGVILIPLFFIIFGLASTYHIMKRDDAIRSEKTLGKTITPTHVKDLTGENYFANFSLLVLTGLAIPTTDNICCLVIYCVIYFSMGIVYINNSMIFINPFLTVTRVSVYKCIAEEDGEEYIFLVKGCTITEKESVNVSNNARKIIRINKITKK